MIMMRTAEMNKCWKMVVTSPLMSLPPFDVGSSKKWRRPNGTISHAGEWGKL
jgi:hypothetical protein